MACTGFYEIEPGQPRLSGRVSYNYPHRWAIQTDTGSVAIVPNTTAIAQVEKFFIVLSIGWPLCLFVLAYQLPAMFGGSKGTILLFALAPSVAWLVAAAVFHRIRNEDVKNGAWFRLSNSSGIFDFPKLGFQVARENVVCWDLVSGCWVRGDHGEASLFDQISEIQLVFKRNDKLFALPILGQMGVSSLEETATQLATVTNVPTQRIRESLSMRNPYRAN